MRAVPFAACSLPFVLAFAPAQAAPEPPRAAQPAPYDPLALAGRELPPPLRLVAHDAGRDRDVPICVQLPPGNAATPAVAAPVVLFSHGLGGTCDGSTFLREHWARRGYVAVFLQHPGSDDSVWRDEPLRERMAAMQRAASAQNLLLRCGDVTFVLDRLGEWNGDEQHDLHGRLDLEHVGMAGHSFGAVTTQAVAGQSLPVLGRRATDERIDAALVLSPSSPRAGDVDRAFAPVAVPWLLMTGTNDTAPIGGQTVASRLLVFPALPATIDRFELVLHEAEHSVFTDRALPGDRRRRDPAHHRAILALSTAFWDAYVRGDAAARAWLCGDGARSVLQEQDRWQSARGSK